MAGLTTSPPTGVAEASGREINSNGTGARARMSISTKTARNRNTRPAGGRSRSLTQNSAHAVTRQGSLSGEATMRTTAHTQPCTSFSARITWNRRARSSGHRIIPPTHNSTQANAAHEKTAGHSQGFRRCTGGCCGCWRAPATTKPTQQKHTAVVLLSSRTTSRLSRFVHLHRLSLALLGASQSVIVSLQIGDSSVGVCRRRL